MSDAATAQAGGGGTAPEKITAEGDLGAGTVTAAKVADGSTINGTGGGETKAAGTLAEGAGKAGGEGQAQVQAKWPDTWRDELAGEDAAFRKRLERVASPGDLAKSYRALEQKLSSGEYKRTTPLAKDATDEQRATWRRDQGLPESEKIYMEKIALPNGVVLGEADKPVAEDFAKAAFAKNWSQETYNDAVAWYYEQQGRAAAARADADKQFFQKSEDALRAEWGNDYRRNIQAINNMATQFMPKGLFEQLAISRNAEGRLLGDDPAFSKWMRDIAFNLFPEATVVPSSSTSGSKGVEERLAEIRKVARENPDAYDHDKSLQKEQEELLAVQSRMKSRAA